MKPNHTKTDIHGYVKDNKTGAILNTNNEDLARIKEKRQFKREMSQLKYEMAMLKEELRTLKEKINGIYNQSS